MKTLNGKFTMLFSSDRGTEIEIEDESSGVAIKVQLNNEDTIKFLSRQAYVNCEVTYPEGLHLLGKEFEVQSLEIEGVCKYRATEEEINDAIEDHLYSEGYAEDGWEVQNNGYRTQQNGKGYQFSIRRWV